MVKATVMYGKTNIAAARAAANTSAEAIVVLRVCVVCGVRDERRGALREKSCVMKKR